VSKAASPSASREASDPQHSVAAQHHVTGRAGRDRVRAATVEEIKDTARGLLVADGPEAVSLRAIGREMGMTAPALYRYFGSRDELLTRLIVDAYDSLGAAAEASETAVDRADLPGRLADLDHGLGDLVGRGLNEHLLKRSPASHSNRAQGGRRSVPAAAARARDQPRPGCLKVLPTLLPPNRGPGP